MEQNLRIFSFYGGAPTLDVEKIQRISLFTEAPTLGVEQILRILSFYGGVPTLGVEQILRFSFYGGSDARGGADSNNFLVLRRLLR